MSHVLEFLSTWLRILSADCGCFVFSWECNQQVVGLTTGYGPVAGFDAIYAICNPKC